MLFRREYQPWLCAATDDKRPVLLLANIVDNGDGTAQIICTDGFMGCAIPCQLEDGDVTGVVTALHLKAAAKAKPNKTEFVHIVLGEDKVTLTDETEMPRVPTDSKGVTFPPFYNIVPKRRIFGQPGPIYVNQELLLACAKAIDGVAKSVLTPSHPTGPAMLELEPPDPLTGNPKLPFAIVMPMSVKNGGPGEQAARLKRYLWEAPVDSTKEFPAEPQPRDEDTPDTEVTI